VIVAVPNARPLVIPLADPIVAILVLLLLQVPPVVASVSVLVYPRHTFRLPAIAAGVVFTVTTTTVAHLLPDI
jgi:hypothetical protein